MGEQGNKRVTPPASAAGGIGHLADDYFADDFDDAAVFNIKAQPSALASQSVPASPAVAVEAEPAVSPAASASSGIDTEVSPAIAHTPEPVSPVANVRHIPPVIVLADAMLGHDDGLDDDDQPDDAGFVLMRAEEPPTLPLPSVDPNQPDAPAHLAGVAFDYLDDVDPETLTESQKATMAGVLLDQPSPAPVSPLAVLGGESSGTASVASQEAAAMEAAKQRQAIEDERERREREKRVRDEFKKRTGVTIGDGESSQGRVRNDAIEAAQEVFSAQASPAGQATAQAPVSAPAPAEPAPAAAAPVTASAPEVAVDATSKPQAKKKRSPFKPAITLTKEQMKMVEESRDAATVSRLEARSRVTQRRFEEWLMRTDRTRDRILNQAAEQVVQASAPDLAKLATKAKEAGSTKTQRFASALYQDAVKIARETLDEEAKKAFETPSPAAAMNAGLKKPVEYVSAAGMGGIWGNTRVGHAFQSSNFADAWLRGVSQTANAGSAKVEARATRERILKAPPSDAARSGLAFALAKPKGFLASIRNRVRSISNTVSATLFGISLRVSDTLRSGAMRHAALGVAMATVMATGLSHAVPWIAEHMQAAHASGMGNAVLAKLDGNFVNGLMSLDGGGKDTYFSALHDVTFPDAGGAATQASVASDNIVKAISALSETNQIDPHASGLLPSGLSAPTNLLTPGMAEIADLSSVGNAPAAHALPMDFQLSDAGLITRADGMSGLMVSGGHEHGMQKFASIMSNDYSGLGLTPDPQPLSQVHEQAAGVTHVTAHGHHAHHHHAHHVASGGHGAEHLTTEQLNEASLRISQGWKHGIDLGSAYDAEHPKTTIALEGDLGGSTAPVSPVKAVSLDGSGTQFASTHQVDDGKSAFDRIRSLIGDNGYEQAKAARASAQPTSSLAEEVVKALKKNDGMSL